MRSRSLLVILGLLFLLPPGSRGEQGLVASWPCDEGQGAVLHDRTGHGGDGRIHGAKWVRCGRLFALEFDGLDDEVDLGTPPALNLSRAVSVEMWVKAAGTPSAGEPGIFGKSYESFVLTHYVDGNAWWYISGGGNNARAPLAAGTWHHVAGTFDGKQLRLYVDGALAGIGQSKAATIGRDDRCFVGTSSGNRQFTKGKNFRGMVSQIRVYDRAISADEVAHHYRSTWLTGQLDLRVIPDIYARQWRTAIDTRALGKLPQGARLRIEVARDGRLAPSEIHQTPLTASQTTAEVAIAGSPRLEGEYVFHAMILAGDGKQIATSQPVRIVRDRPQSKEPPGVKVLNNLVSELLSVTLPAANTSSQFEFLNPRQGWVFVSSTIDKGEAGPVSVLLDSQPLQTHRGPGTLEAMRLLSKGTHQVRVTPPAALERLVVRAVPELIYAKSGADPHVGEYGKYDWTFLSRYVLPNINVLVASGSEDEKPRLREWRQAGRKCLVECGVPGVGGDRLVAADEVWRFWSSHPGMTDPGLNGVIADEFFSGNPAQWAAWSEALRRLRADDRFNGKRFYPYCGPLYGDPAGRQFAQVVMDAGWQFAVERYLPEQRSASLAGAYLDATLREPIAAWRKVMPGAESHIVACLGTFSQPPESLDVNPAVNHKVYLDMQMHLLADEPDCFGLGGVMTYLSSYTDEETVRWMGKLFRHYCIEGKREPATADPLVLPHLKNPDFEEGLKGWTVAAAGPGTVDARTRPGFSWLQGRYPKTSQGDTILWMKRSPLRPNVVRQDIRSLQPGRLYTLRMFVADYQDLSVRQKCSLRVEVGGAEVVRDKSFVHVFPNCYSHHDGPFNDRHQAWMNYHWTVFRAKGEQSALSISDWASPSAPGGPPGQQLMVNFVQVQPYEP